jgi:hypothetical protein
MRKVFNKITCLSALMNKSQMQTKFGCRVQPPSLKLIITAVMTHDSHGLSPPRRIPQRICEEDKLNRMYKGKIQF